MHQHRAKYAQWLGETNDITRMFLAASQIPDMINMAGGLPESSVYPTEDLARIAQDAIADHPGDALDYGPIEGLPALRQLIADRFSNDDLNLTMENVLVTSGGMQGLDLIGKALLDQDDVIACQSPSYLGALDAWRPRQPQYRPFYPEAMDFNGFQSLEGAKFAYTVPNFSNPTGKLIDTATRQSLAEASEQTGTWLVEDDPYGTLYYDSKPLPRILSLSADDT
ncbi:MAG: PLP-dependent aminotransferase family protein, partial [Granulosicoccus sp.]|nr:PLP-dependent aminotransferase family protein [Granulosicoccus sp.]